MHIFFGEVSVIAHFLIELFVFLLLSFKNSFCILDTTLYLGDIFVQSMTFLFIPVTASSRSYIIFSYTFRFIIHFMLIFMETVRSMSRPCFFGYGWMPSCSFSSVSPLLLCQKAVDNICVNLWQIPISPVPLIYLSIIS